MKVVIVGGGAGGISTASNLRKMDNINGNDGASFPDWKKELTKTIYDIRNFTKNIKDEYI